MPELDDQQLLAEFARSGAEAAFTELVRRHAGLVFSTAFRFCHDAHHAEEISQAVFIILARKAGTLSSRVILSGWLYQTARLTAANFVKAEMRRRRRELEGAMQSNLPESEASDWDKIAPLLDEAMGALGDTDRHALLLRYFENRTSAEIGVALRMNEETARKRVNRALEKLRQLLGRRGVTVSGTALSAAIAANSIQPIAPILVKSLSAVALAKGAAASISTLTLIKGTLKIMAWTKAKTAVLMGTGLLLATATAIVTIHEFKSPGFNPADFRATTYPTGGPDMITKSYGHPLNYSFPISPVQLCSINGLLNQCMEVSGWRYLMDKDVAAGGVNFGCPKVMNGEEWVAAFENALRTGAPGWWDQKSKKFRQENLVLIRYPKEKTVLVLPKDKAEKYR
ncbi:MAG TPA: sigma-70 family RNA polymerase sigma factor [Verrucomicrobiae bacterium]